MVIVKVCQLAVIEPEISEISEDAPQPCHHAVAAPRREVPGEYLEYALARSGTVFKRRIEHSVFVHIGHHCR